MSGQAKVNTIRLQKVGVGGGLLLSGQAGVEFIRGLCDLCIESDLWSNRNLYANECTYFIAIDSPMRAFYRHGVWNYMIFDQTVTLYDDTGFTWVNQGSATITSSRGYALLTGTANATTNWHLRLKPLPTTGTFELIAFMKTTTYNVNFMNGALILYDSTTGKFITWGVSEGQGVTCFKYNSTTSFNAAYTIPAMSACGHCAVGYWFAISQDSTNRKFYISKNGIDFEPILTTTRTDFITPNFIGYGLNSENSLTSYLDIYSWYLNYSGTVSSSSSSSGSSSSSSGSSSSGSSSSGSFTGSCPNCTSTPTSWTMGLAGFSNRDCTFCGFLNTNFDLPKQSTCVWGLSVFDPCGGGVQLTLTVSGPTIIVTLGTRATWTGTILGSNCLTSYTLNLASHDSACNYPATILVTGNP